MTIFSIVLLFLTGACAGTAAGYLGTVESRLGAGLSVGGNVGLPLLRSRVATRLSGTQTTLPRAA